jgi:hypothetical protein
MKKVLVAAAGLMLVGTMASSAMAEFKFSGDARARYYFQNDYDNAAFANAQDSDNSTLWNSRVRFKIEADTKGGAYVKTRVRLSEGTWDGTAETRAKGEGTNFYTDYAYIGVPFGAVTVEAGLMPRNITPWFFFDGRSDSVQFNYKSDNTSVLAFYDIEDENYSDGDDDTTTALEASTALNDDDAVTYGLVLNQKFNGGWAMTAAAVYTDDEIADDDGFAGTVNVAGAVGSTALAAELSYVEDANGDDDGFGGYVSATMPLGSVELLGMAGFTVDGFEMDAADFGPFIMLNDFSQIGTGYNFAEKGDSMFISLAPTMKVSETLTLGAQVTYANVDVDGGDDIDAFDIGATASYAVTDGASLNGVIGYLDIDGDDDNAFGAGLSLEISF